jgi:four helix bundle protein
MEQSILVTKSKVFALQVIQLFQGLQSQWEFILSKQILRSGTSIGANIREAIAGQSKDELIKMLASTKITSEQNMNYQK